MQMPNVINNVKELDDFLTIPSEHLIESLNRMSGGLMILGAGGKMGISLAILAKRGLKETGSKKKVYAVSTFSNRMGAEELRRNDVEVIFCDRYFDTVGNNRINRNLILSDKATKTAHFNYSRNT